MKKLVVVVMVGVASITATKAQFYVGGGLGFWHEPTYSTSFWIEPEAGYSFNERWTIGLSIGFEHITYYEPYIIKKKYTKYFFYASPYARFNYFSTDKIKLFLDGVVGISTGFPADFGFQVIVRPGISINLTDHFTLIGTFGALGYRQSYRNTRDGFGLDLSNSLRVGFYYSF